MSETWNLSACQKPRAGHCVFFAAGCPYGSVDLWPGRELTGQTSARPIRLADALVRFGHSGVQSAVVFCSNANGKLSIVLESDVQNQGAADLFGNLWRGPWLPLGDHDCYGVVMAFQQLAAIL